MSINRYSTILSETFFPVRLRILSFDYECAGYPRLPIIVTPHILIGLLSLHKDVSPSISSIPQSLMLHHRLSQTHLLRLFSLRFV